MGIRARRRQSSSCSSFLEPLEPRTLLAGVTVITHGYDDNATGWEAVMAQAIVDRAGGSSAVSLYTLQIGLDSQQHLAVLSFTPDAGSPVVGAASTGETVVKIDWSTVSLGPWSTTQVGDLATNYLLQAHDNLPALAELPIHLIGHSRGTSVNSEIARDLGQHGIWVDQFTSLDPNPSVSHHDEPMISWSNIIFAEDYWRTSTNDISGQSVSGAYLQSLQASVGANPDGPPHQGVHAWYYGTINLTGTSDGFALRNEWYGSSVGTPPRDQTGFYFSAIGGGDRPLSGISPAFGGTAQRTDPGKTGGQWPNVNGITITGAKTVKSGQPLHVHFTQEERRGSSRVEIFLDQDRTPYNGITAVGERRTFARTVNPVRTARECGTKGIAPGTYYVGVKIMSADGSTRYDYARGTVTII